MQSGKQGPSVAIKRLFQEPQEVSHSDYQVPNKLGMHRCFKVTEILKYIFSNFYIATRANHRSLYAFALVSKAFHEPVLDVLWALQGSALRLVKTLPVEAWKETGDPSTLVSFPLQIFTFLMVSHVACLSFFNGLSSRQTLIDFAFMDGE
jgi:hypothetical protein